MASVGLTDDTINVPASEPPVPLFLTHHALLLQQSAISEEVAQERGYRSIIETGELRKLGFKSPKTVAPGLLIPIYDSFDGVIYQYRPDTPRLDYKGRILKYEFPSGTKMCLDVPKRVRPQLADPSIPLFITEGARKVDSALSQGLCCIGVNGVWNWRGNNDKGGVTALADWENIALKGRKVFIVFDSDAMTKFNVHRALSRLKAFLERRGANG